MNLMSDSSCLPPTGSTSTTTMMMFPHHCQWVWRCMSHKRLVFRCLVVYIPLSTHISPRKPEAMLCNFLGCRVVLCSWVSFASRFYPTQWTLWNNSPSDEVTFLPSVLAVVTIFYDNTGDTQILRASWWPCMYYIWPTIHKLQVKLNQGLT